MSLVYLNDNKHIYLSDYNLIINAELKDYFLKHANGKKVKFTQRRIDKEAIQHGVRDVGQVIFQTTQDCTLRCKYCVYGGTYKYQRDLVRNVMTWETARRGMDYIYDIIKDRQKKDLAISFYGGEPLMNFEVVEKSVEYAKEKFKDIRDVKFFMTTNLTLLDDRMLELIVTNDFNLSVSLDGPREHQNAKRVFPDGSGSFDIVMKNLQRIKDRDPKYFKEKIGMETVYSKDLPVDKMVEFFTNNELVKENRMMFSFVDEYDTCYYEKYPYSEDEVSAGFRKLNRSIRDKIKNEVDLIPVERAMSTSYGRMKRYLEARNFSNTANTCVFDSKLLIDSEGRFHVCEKINDQFPFGDVWKGFDFDRMEQILGDFCDTVEKHCSDCEYRCICFRCFIPFAKDGKMRFDENFCKEMKENCKEGLEKRITNEIEGVI